MKITNLQGTTTLHNGVEMPYFGLGVFKVNDGDEVYDACRYALANGYKHIDTAALYGNEIGVGKAVNDSGLDRKDIFVTSKVWNTDHGYDTTLKAFEKSMERINLDYLDLYLVHWPTEKRVDTWKALEKLYKDGRVKAIGVSNFLQHHLEGLLEVVEIVPMVNQMEFSPRLVQQSLIDFCQANKIQYQAWSPLMQGKVFSISELQELAVSYDKTIAQVVLRWNLQKGVVTIPKSITESRIIENAKIFDFEISASDMAKIDALDQEFRVGADPDNFSF